LAASSENQRTIIIGDVHGCIRELETLLKETRAQPQDRLIAVGDLICKGPENAAVLEWAMATSNLTCVLGNHEARFLKYWRTGAEPTEKAYDPMVVEQWGEKLETFMRFLATWPLFVSESDFSVVHAGLDPGRGGFAAQEESCLLNVRAIGDQPWYERYREDKLIVFGHWARRDPVLRPNAIGLDTGCVYGGALSALILPERRVVTIPARREYYRKTQWS